jgi:hypothetical protein
MRFHMDAMLAASPPAPNKRDAATRVRYIFLEGHHGQKNKDQEAVPAGRLFFRRFQSLCVCIRRTSYKAGRSGAERFQTSIKAQQKEAPGALTASRAAKKRNQSAQQANDNPHHQTRSPQPAPTSRPTAHAPTAHHPEFVRFPCRSSSKLSLPLNSFVSEIVGKFVNSTGFEGDFVRALEKQQGLSHCMPSISSLPNAILSLEMSLRTSAAS